MVKWNEFVVSGSGGLSQQTPRFPYENFGELIKEVLKEVAVESEKVGFSAPSKHDDDLDVARLGGSSWRPIGVQNFNAEVYQKIRDVYGLAVSFDSSMEVVSKIHEIIIEYQRTAVLTKDEMIFLNQMHKLLSFEAKFHKDKQTTIGAISNILGALNDQKD